MDYNVQAAVDSTAAISIVEKQRPKATFIDIRMPGTDDVELLGHLKTIVNDIQVVMITIRAGLQEAVSKL